MTRYVAGRVLQAVVVLWAVYTLTFGILYLLPSDPVELQLAAANVQVNELTPAELAAAKQQYGLDQPLGHQYLDHLGGLLRGDFGRSISLHRPVGRAAGRAAALHPGPGRRRDHPGLVLGGGLATWPPSSGSPG